MEWKHNLCNDNRADEDGNKVNYSSFNRTQAFLDKYENKTSSLSTNTGGSCQFYKSVMYLLASGWQYRCRIRAGFPGESVR